MNANQITVELRRLRRQVERLRRRFPRRRTVGGRGGGGGEAGGDSPQARFIKYVSSSSDLS